MTIGMADRDQQEENPDFKCLLECRRVLAEAGFADLELSMGMSEDYEQAVQMGSTNVRVGSLIFGPRQ